MDQNSNNENFNDTSLNLQRNRAHWLLVSAVKEPGYEQYQRTTLLIAAITFCRSIAEQMCDTVEKLTKTDFKSVDTELSGYFRHYKLIKMIREQDFHRHAVNPLPGQFQFPSLRFKGKGDAEAVFDLRSGDLEIQTGGQNNFRVDKDLRWKGTEVLDVDTSEYLSMEKMIADFLIDFPSALEKARQKYFSTPVNSASTPTEQTHSQRPD